jgi:hypothetical protein
VILLVIYTVIVVVVVVVLQQSTIEACWCFETEADTEFVFCFGFESRLVHLLLFLNSTLYLKGLLFYYYK